MTNYENNCHLNSPAGINHIDSFRQEHDFLRIEFVGVCTLGSNSFRLVNGVVTWIKLFKILYDSDSVIIYHSLRFMRFAFLLRIFRRKIIYQLNEIYSVAESKPFRYWLEYRFVRLFENFIIANSSMKRLLKRNSKSIVRGGYFMKASDYSSKKSENHFCYCGRIDEAKMGNLSLAKELIRDLSTSHQLDFHIFGPDTKELEKYALDKCNVRIFINSSFENMSKNLARVRYGFVLQSDLKPFNETSFPSKIYMYLSLGITPIAINSFVLKNCEVSNHIKLISEWNWSAIRSGNSDLDDSLGLDSILVKRKNEFLELL